MMKRIITIILASFAMMLPTVAKTVETGVYDGFILSIKSGSNIAGLAGVEDENMTDVVLPEYIRKDYNVWYIGYICDGAFEGNTTVRSVKCCKYVKYIGCNAFAGCTALETLEMPEVTTICGNAFDGCTGLQTVEMPKVTSIGNEAFKGCELFEDIIIGAPLSYIGDGAFAGSRKLREATINNYIPRAKEDRNRLEWSPLRDCKGLETVTIDSPIYWQLNRSDFIYHMNGSMLKEYPNTFYLNQPSIGVGMVDGCDALEELIVNHEHYYPTGALRDLPSLHSITLGGRGITYLDADAITGCYITTIRCTSPVPPVVIETEEPIEVDKATCVVKIPVGCTAVYRANCYWGSYANIVEDSEMTPAFNVSEVQPQVYINNDGTMGYTIDRENGTVSVSGPCFQLMDVEDDGTPLFENTVVNRENLDIRVEWYDEEGYRHISPAISKNMGIDLPEGTIKHQGREYEVTKIAPYAGAYNGVKAYFGQWCEEIGDYAYYKCPWPEGQKLLLGPSISRIGRKVFADVPTLTCIRVTCGTPAEMDLTAFGDRSLIDLEVPEGKAAVYRAAAGWRDFRNITEYRTAGVSDIMTDVAPDGPSEYYTTDGRRVSEEQMGRGIYIERRADGTVTKIRR